MRTSNKSLGGLFMAFGVALLVAGCSSSQSSNTAADCPVGSEGCPCTNGGGCDVGLVCFDPICFRADAGPTGGTGASTGTGGSAGSSSGGTGAASGGTSSGGSSSGGSSSGGSSGGGSADCPFPGQSSTAMLQTDLSGQSKDNLPAVFIAGTLTSLDGKACSKTTSAPAPVGDWSTYACFDAYDCGGCIVYLLSPDTATTPGNWFLIGVDSATYGATTGCPEFGGNYSICAPDCAGKTCGDDGCNGWCGSGCGKSQCCSSQNQCVTDTCSECLDACSGLPSCCQGAGCICESACPGPC